MALIFMDGFDHYATADLAKKGWSGNGCIIGATGRNGTNALKPQGYTYSVKHGLPANLSTAILGMRHNSGGNFSTSAERGIMYFLDGGLGQMTLAHNSVGGLEVRRGFETGTIIGTSANGILIANAEQYIEFKVTFHATAGTAEVRVNGTTVISLTGQNTKTTSNAYANVILVNHAGVPFSNNGSIDDLYVCDGTGSTNNDFLGDVRIDTLYPTSDGTYSQFTPSTGTEHYSLVDETNPNATDYVDGSTVGQIDSYGMGDLSPIASQIVYGVKVNAAVLKDDAGAKSVATMVRSGSTDAAGASAALGTSQTYVSQIYETNPSGSAAWTEAAVNAMEAGVKVTA